MFTLVAACVPGAACLAQVAPNSERAIRQLEFLASKNPAPRGRNPGKPEFGFEYKLADQRVVEEAIKALIELDEDALPALVKGITDERYCVTVKDSTGYYNYSVGRVCHEILRERIDAAIYNRIRRVGPRRSSPSYFHTVVWAKQDAGVSAWWEINGSKGLAAIQLDAIKWAIARETERGFESVEEEEMVLRALNSASDGIKKSSKPIAPRDRALDFRYVNP